MNMKTRRQFFKLMSGVGLGYALTSRTRGQSPESDKVQDLLATRLFSEEQSSDPDAAVERLDFAPGQLQKAITAPRPFGQSKNARDVSLRMLELSRSFAKDGVSRDHHSGQVREFLDLFGFGLRYDGGGDYVPYCAAGVSYAVCRAYCDMKKKEDYKVTDITYDDARMNLFKEKLRDIGHYYFLPSPAVRFIKADAEERKPKIWVDAKETPLPGWLVVFSWHGKGANHIGIVDHADDKNLYTVEYNTALVQGNQRNGGLVANKTRARDNTVMGFVKLY
jgi:hypothetical protein